MRDVVSSEMPARRAVGHAMELQMINSFVTRAPLFRPGRRRMRALSLGMGFVLTMLVTLVLVRAQHWLGPNATPQSSPSILSEWPLIAVGSDLD
jgi:hypothetical protein